VNPIGDDFLLSLAEISAALTGLFLVGMILYIQIGYERTERSRAVVEPYFRAATSITFIAYAIPVVVPLTLVALPVEWSVALYYALVAGLIVVNVSTVSTVRKVQREMRLNLLAMIEAVGTVVIALMVILPLALGGLSPDRGDLVPGIMLSLFIAFLGTWALVLTLFDIARFERSNPPTSDPDTSPPSTDSARTSADHIEPNDDADPSEAREDLSSTED
jgi:hypothetical protein